MAFFVVVVENEKTKQQNIIRIAIEYRNQGVLA